MDLSRFIELRRDYELLSARLMEPIRPREWWSVYTRRQKVLAETKRLLWEVEPESVGD